MVKLGWEFPADTSGQWDGFNDPNIEHFAGDRLQHLGREIVQNTIDARLGQPAKIAVSLVKVPTSSIPNVLSLKSAVDRCRPSAASEANDKAIKFFANADKLLNAKEISVLQIRDSNTTGVAGPCKNGTPFFAMMKATGQSKKGDTSTGSYGIGKFAPFAVSELRTVFVSTVWQENRVLTHYVQGKSVLMSHYDNKNQTRRGTGFWGVTNQCQPVEGVVSQLPSWLKMTDKSGGLRAQRGTMISILGFVPTKGWQEALCVNIVSNFFGAIARGELEVQLDNAISINKSTLSNLVGDINIRQAVSEQPGEVEKYDDVAHYLRALEGGSDVIVEKRENFHLGEFVLHVLLGENLPKKVAVLRNGMLITESLPGLKRFSDFKDFAAVLECPTQKGLAFLRAMEPPKHDSFEPDRLSPDRRQAGRTALRELSQKVREILERHAKDPIAEETRLDELADFFGDEDEKGDGKIQEENPDGKILIRVRRVEIKTKPAALAADTLDDDEARDVADDATEGPSERPKPRETKSDSNDRGAEGELPGDTPAPAKTSKISTDQPPARPSMQPNVPIENVRAIMLSANVRRVSFTPPRNATIGVELQDSGADTNHTLMVKKSSLGTVVNGRVEGVQVSAGKRCSIDVELEKSFNGTLRVVASAI